MSLLQHPPVLLADEWNFLVSALAANARHCPVRALLTRAPLSAAAHQAVHSADGVGGADGL